MVFSDWNSIQALEKTVFVLTCKHVKPSNTKDKKDTEDNVQNNFILCNF